jgi:hypothetical protein
LLCEVDQEHDHVRDALAGNGRCGHQRDIAREAFVVVVEHGIKTLLGEGELCLFNAILEFTFHGRLLLL